MGFGHAGHCSTFSISVLAWRDTACATVSLQLSLRRKLAPLEVGGGVPLGQRQLVNFALQDTFCDIHLCIMQLRSQIRVS